ncbi:MAG: DUF4422 domain-containing protein [Selenomonadaceae bacterium]|nr:DUF4422 domain-containing protein [Selenomonadaceae bacterium]
MQHENYIPRILLCGDETEFLARVDNRPYKIIGHAKISGEVDGQQFNIIKDEKVFFNDELQDFNALKNFLLGGEVDYLVFATRELFLDYHRVAVMHYGLVSPKAVTVEQFNLLPREFFYDANIPLRMLEWMKLFSVKTLLDVDGFFATVKVFTKPGNESIEIDCVTEKNLPPIAENVYRRVYKNLAEVGLKKYDAVLLPELSPNDFNAAFSLTENFSDTVFTFGRTDGELKNHLLKITNNFSEARGFTLMTGDLFYLKRHRPPESFRTFVVTYKNIKLDAPPEGYEILQAGHAVNADTGYTGDDTGDNISDLNVYLNELTALYWMWKNSSDSIVGLCHYRRFFTLGDDKFSREKILSKDDALKILETHDMIVSRLFYGVMTQREFIEHDCGKRLEKIGEAIFRKHLLRVHPDYLEAFDFVMNSKAIYKCHLFITRREILDAYCKWLFAFLLDVTKETLQIVPLDKFSFTPRRLVAFFAERMLMTWLFKQRLRLKELAFMFVEGI